jgi:hypothetical protein
MTEQGHMLLLTEIRDLARQQISRQIINQELLIRGRKWTRILHWRWLQ